jgi:hypothetical protein
MEVIWFSETVDFQWTTWHYVPDGSSLNIVVILLVYFLILRLNARIGELVGEVVARQTRV